VRHMSKLAQHVAFPWQMPGLGPCPEGLFCSAMKPCYTAARMCGAQKGSIGRMAFTVQRAQGEPPRAAHLGHRLERPARSGQKARTEAEEVKARLRSCRNDDAGDDRDKRRVRRRAFALVLNQEAENGSEERRCRADRLVERDRDKAKRGIAENNGDCEHCRERCDLDELVAALDALERDGASCGEARAEQRAGSHVQEREQHGVFETEGGQEPFVEKDDTDICKIPAGGG
jgi:hypothetical protein